MSLFKKPKGRSSAFPNSPDQFEGPPLSLPVDDEALIQNIANERQSNIDFADVVQFQCKKYKEVTGASLFIDYFTISFIRAKKVLVDFHILEIEKIESPNPREVILFFRDDHPEITIKTHWSHSVENGDYIIKAILGAWRYCFPSAPKSARPFTIQPSEKWELLNELIEEDPGPCIGYLHSYMSICYFYGTEPKKEIIEHIRVLAAHGSKNLNIFEFSHASEEDLSTLIHGLQYNTYFTTFAASSPITSPEILSLLMTVLISNTQLKEFSIPGIGLTATYLKQLVAGIQAQQGSLSVASINLSHNPLEDKGLEAFSELIAGLNYGPVQLTLSDLSTSKKGGVVAFCNSLRKNPHLLVTLSTLDLSFNKFDQDASNALAAWLASPNALATLHLEGTGVNVDKLADALLRGSTANLCKIYLGKNKIKSLERLSQFVKTSQVLQCLDLSENPLDMDSLLALVRNIIVNYSIFDFELILQNVALDPGNAETLLGLLSHNIKLLDISQNFLGANGLEVVGNGLSSNTCLETLVVSSCFQQSKKENSPPSESFSLFLRNNTKLKTLIMKADNQTALGGELLPIIEALTSNSTLTSLDISGHQGEDLIAAAIGRLLQVNSSLRSLELDDNAISLVGFQRLRDGLSRNSTLQQMTMPVFDAMSLTKKQGKSSGGTLSGSQRSSSLQSSANTLSAIIKEMESKISQNYSRPTGAQLTKSSPLSSAEDVMKFRFINAARQKELDVLVQRIRSTGKNTTPEQKNLFTDASSQMSRLAHLQAREEETQKQLQFSLQKKADEFAKSVQEIVQQANRQFKEESLKMIAESYQGLTPENLEKIQKIWDDSTFELTDERLRSIIDEMQHEIIMRETEKASDLLGRTSTFLYDSIGANLQLMLKEFLQESIRKELGDADPIKSNPGGK